MSPQIQLKMHDSKATIIPNRGGLLTSLIVDGREVLFLPPDFSSRDSSWPGGGVPICFPFAGRVWNSGVLYQYRLGDQIYHMPLHGFAYACEWQKVKQTDAQVHLSLAHSEASLRLFPFEFECQLTFTLGATGIDIGLLIFNHSNHEMPVALGWHPYFKINQAATTQVGVPSAQYHVVTPNGAAGKIGDTNEFGPGPWTIETPMMQSLIFTDLQKGFATLSLSDIKENIQISFGPKDVFNHVVVWSNNLAEFYCVEPWMSLPDAVNIASGCQWLKPGKSLQTLMSIQIKKP